LRTKRPRRDNVGQPTRRSSFLGHLPQRFSTEPNSGIQPGMRFVDP
jgi:hypothetical protein